MKTGALLKQLEKQIRINHNFVDILSVNKIVMKIHRRIHII